MEMRLAYLSMHRQANAHLSALGVTADQFVCLFALMGNEGVIQSELVRLTHSDPNTMSAMVVLLEKKGFVRREPHASDRRARILWLTDAGRKVAKQSMKALEDTHARIGNALTEEEAATLVNLLGRVSQCLK